tara:strand:- start:9 stop:1490 length:1482 start_codon:yes stop_codon:yes gene_type:complete
VKKYNQLIEYVKTTEALVESAGLISWDQETMMPKGSFEQRAVCLSEIEKVIHLRRSNEFIEELLSSIILSKLNQTQKANIRHISKSFYRSKKIPVQLASELARVTSLSQSAWAEARKRNDANEFLKIFKDVVYLRKQEAQALSNNNKNIYDALLDDYEPSMTSAKLDPLFYNLRTELVNLRQSVLDKNVKFKQLNKVFEKDIQLKLSNELSLVFGFNFNIGRIDLSEHPFSSGSGKDVRITTRVSETDPFNCFYSTIHETGHAVYEQNIENNLIFSPNGHGASMAVHESQSRLFENQLGRSFEFCCWLFKRMKDEFGDFNLQNEKEFYFYINKVENNFIRTEADELQYNLHILMRYDLEKALINGELSVNDLENTWNERFAKDFGFEVDKPSNGFLQDVHWPAGLFGYFPTYTLGNIYAGCIYEKMTSDIPHLMADLSNGDTLLARSWLKNKIHKFGSIKSPINLLEDAIKNQTDEKPLINYLTKKFKNLYNL